MRELAALKLDHWLDEEAGQVPLIDPIPAPIAVVAHSGISIVCDVVKRVLSVGTLRQAQGPQLKSIDLPASGSAKESNHQLTVHLRETAASHPDTAPFINAFLAGDLITVTEMLESLPITSWEQFAIQCGTVNRDRWTSTRKQSASPPLGG